MGKLRHEIAIDAPAEQVWRVLADLEQVQHYNPLVAQARYISSSREGIGAARRCEFTPKGFSVERVIDWRPQEVLGLEVVESSWPLKSSRWWTKLSQENGQTRVSPELEYQPKRVVSEIFGGLKEFVERREP
jgi:ligand-binding SRPBCC domain-containing protein